MDAWHGRAHTLDGNGWAFVTDSYGSKHWFIHLGCSLWSLVHGVADTLDNNGRAFLRETHDLKH